MAEPEKSGDSSVKNEEEPESVVEESNIDHLKNEGEPESVVEESNIDHLKVETAVKFLLNPKVVGSPLSRQIAFLKQKGLTDAEIKVAVDTSHVKERQGETLFPGQNEGMGVVPSIGPSQPRPPENQRSWRDVVGVAVVGVGFVYGLGCLVKSQVLPYLFGRPSDQSVEDQQQFKLTLQELRGGFGDIALEMRDTFTNIQKSLEEQQQAITAFKSDMQAFATRMDAIPADIPSLTELKSEVSSLKGLILGRRQFPPSPFSASGASPSIPAWQKVSSQRSDSKVSSSTPCTSTGNVTSSDASSKESGATVKSLSQPVLDDNEAFVSSASNTMVSNESALDSESKEEDESILVSDEVSVVESPHKMANEKCLAEAVSEETIEQGEVSSTNDSAYMTDDISGKVTMQCDDDDNLDMRASSSTDIAGTYVTVDVSPTK